MRFLENGPSIPSHLLQQQSLGNVIFFCGAGVSMPAGLDSFWQLTDRIVTALDSAVARKMLDESFDFDRIFNVLVKEFGRGEIDRQIFKALGTARAKTLAHHRAILALAKSETGKTQLVTTNFDLLFERAGCRAPKIVPPNLPNLELNQSVDGLVYLHGRLADPDSSQTANYVISSADFGRAYLAEAWATRFVKELRERYTLVFLGYRADDPPMRYLLEGLNDRDGVVYDNHMFAFADQADSNALEAWHDRGVTSIPYNSSGKHAALWETIHAWSAASEDETSWAAAMLKLASQTPRDLKPFERGQVVEFVSHKAGAAKFADAEPPPSAEWLCVFDPNSRFAKPRKQTWVEDAEEVDPQKLFGLDEEPARPPPSANRIYADGVLSPLSWNDSDEGHPERSSLLGSYNVYRNPIPPRLHNLARWFGSICHEPAAVWWAAGWTRLSEHLLWFAARRLRDRQGGKLPDLAAQFWSFHLEHEESYAFDDQEYRWFEFEGMVKSLGWNGHTLRYFEKCVRPTVSAERPSLSLPCPPQGDWDAVAFRDVCELKVKVLDRHNTELKVPKEVLPDFVRMIRISFQRMLELLEEVGDEFWRPPNLHPSDLPGESFPGNKKKIVLWFAQLFKLLSEHDITLARQELELWPKQDARLFDKLRIWAATLPNLVSDSEAHAMLLGLGDEAFWSSEGQRGVLLLMKQRWGQLSSAKRRSLEKRIEDGPPHWPYQSDEEFKSRKASHAASRLRWLELNDCKLSKVAKHSLGRLKLVDTRWTDKWAEGADDSLGSRGGMISEVTDVQGLDKFAVSEIVDEARALTKEKFEELRHYHPFRGLVEDHPSKALSALRLALKQDEFPVDFWTDLLGHWPKRTSLRARLLLGHTVARLTDEQALELRYYSTGWLKENLPVLYRVRPKQALDIFDGFLRPFLNGPATATKSGIGQTKIGNEVQVASEVSIGKAINSPIGKLTQALWSLLPRIADKRGRPDEGLELRFRKLTSVPGDGGGHAVAILTEHLGWIVYCYADWANELILPMFDLQSPHAEAAWHGWVYNQNSLPTDTWHKIKPPFLSAVRGEVHWPIGSEEKRALIDALIWLSDPTLENGAVFKFKEVRQTLKGLDDQGRGHALWALANALGKKKNWAGFAKPFIESAWPREKVFRSEEATRGFLRIAEAAGPDFGDAVSTVKSLMRPVPYADTFTYRLTKEFKDEDEEDVNNAKKYPLEAIQLLDAITGDDKTVIPYGLADSLVVLGEIDPEVKDTREFRRLKALVD